jgi:hypothetical protein
LIQLLYLGVDRRAQVVEGLADAPHLDVVNDDRLVFENETELGLVYPLEGFQVVLRFAPDGFREDHETRVRAFEAHVEHPFHLDTRTGEALFPKFLSYLLGELVQSADERGSVLRCIECCTWLLNFMGAIEEVSAKLGRYKKN